MCRPTTFVGEALAPSKTALAVAETKSDALSLYGAEAARQAVGVDLFLPSPRSSNVDTGGWPDYGSSSSSSTQD